MAARLSDLARIIPDGTMIGETDPIISTVTCDSREVEGSSLFIAIRGFQQDGHRFIADALHRGAVAAAGEDLEVLQHLSPSVGRLLVQDARMALPLASAAVFGHPSDQLKLIGVTGTNGKTTTVNLSAAVMEAAGLPAATLGTLGLSVRGKVVPGDRTTPEASALQRTLRQLVDDGIQAVAMEVSSHAIDLRRTMGCSFDAALFTNLTQDHLDYHASMEEYYQAKKRLFSEYPAASRKAFTAVINSDDPYGARLAGEVSVPVLTFGLGPEAMLRAEGPEVGPASVFFTATLGDLRFPVRVPIGAHFNVYNALGAVGVGLALGVSPEKIAQGLESARAVSGRFESVDCGQPYTVIVDYAHSPDGLFNVLRSARQITANRLLVVFGCGGDRDSTKRPKMGAIAAEMADRVIVTSDNPRTEPPARIIEQILVGIPAEDRCRTAVCEDRRQGIAQALGEAGEGDVVVIAGKGHENYQIFADRTIHFDDREVVRELLEKAPRRDSSDSC